MSNAEIGEHLANMLRAVTAAQTGRLWLPAMRAGGGRRARAPLRHGIGSREIEAHWEGLPAVARPSRWLMAMRERT
jgi:hypothetical protein